MPAAPDTDPWPTLSEVPTARLSALRRNLEDWAQELGFDALGITGIDLSAHEQAVRDWLANGFQGSMSYLERNLEKRLHPEQLIPGTARVICVRMNYAPAEDAPFATLEDPASGYIARYALGRDYHKVLRRRLARLGERLNAAAAELDPRYRAFTDSAPVLERPLAANAGLGWVGKHTLLLNREAGSWFFLGELYTNLPLPLDEPTVESHCGACRACITVCPTQAIVAPGVLDARRCISYQTIENKGDIPASLRPAIGNRIFGCDDCQLYCPWNREAPTSRETDFTPRQRRVDPAAAPLDLRRPDLVALFELDQAGFEALTEGSAMRRISHVQWQRNLAVALGNGRASARARNALERRRRELLRARATSAPPAAETANPTADERTMLLEHIDWALDRLQSAPQTAE